jgi:hypothetical protein
MLSEHEIGRYVLKQVLVHALLAGCNRQDVVVVLLFTDEIEYVDIPRFLNACGVDFPNHHHLDEGINPDRLRQLRELSLSDG